MKKMVVMGSLNIDVFFKIKRMPKVGESIGVKEDCFKAFGGKGSNQALAAARLLCRDRRLETGETVPLCTHGVQMLG